MAYNIAPSKQDLLVSGTNIKTINSNSILGSGNLTIAGLPTSTNPTDADKVVAVDSSGVASWQYAGLGSGGFGSNDVILGRSKPTGFTGTGTVIIGSGAGTNAVTNSVLIGYLADGYTESISIGKSSSTGNYGLAIGISSFAGNYGVGIGHTASGSGDGIAIGKNASANSSCLAIGISASGTTGMAIGNSSSCSGTDSTAVGVGSTASGQYTTAIGAYATTAAIRSVAIGYGAGYGSTNTASYSTFVGMWAGKSGVSGAGNTLIGAESGKDITSGASNTILGSQAAPSLSSGSGNIFLGYLSGKYSTTQSNELFIDNQDRTNYATQQTNSLIYGVFNATPASQTLKFNAATTSTYGYLTALGSVTAPTYSFTGDTNTGLWSSAADTVNLSTGGSERLRVDSGGVVRINTTALIGTNVSEKLEIKGVIKAVGTDASNLGWFYAMGDGTTWGGGFQIWKDNSSSSNVWAIAMQTPGSAISDDLVISNPDGGWHECLRIKKAGDVIINETGASVDVRIEGDTDANLLVTDGSADRVGIGTATPQEKLDVGTGNARVSNGDLILNTAGNGLKIKTGADATAGLATISNGNSSVTVNTNKCSATSIILVTNQTSTAYVAVTTKTSGSFKIEHANTVGADQECAWFIINPA